MNKAHAIGEAHLGKSVEALKDSHVTEAEWHQGTIIGGWEDNEQVGVKVQFEDGEIQDVPMDFVRLDTVFSDLANTARKIKQEREKAYPETIGEDDRIE